MIEIHPVRLHQHPMNSGNADSVFVGRIANFLPLLLPDFGNVFADRKRRDLNRVITRLCRKGHRVVERPALEYLITNGKLHFPSTDSPHHPLVFPFFRNRARAGAPSAPCNLIGKQTSSYPPGFTFARFNPSITQIPAPSSA